MNEIALSLLFMRLLLALALFAADTMLALSTFRKYHWRNVGALFFDAAFGLAIGVNYFAPGLVSQLFIGLILTPSMLFYFAAKIITVRQNGHEDPPRLVREEKGRK